MAKIRGGYMFKRGGRYYLQLNVDGHRSTTTLKRPDGLPCKTEREADKARLVAIAPLAVSGKREKLRNLADRIAGLDREAVELQDAQNHGLALADAWRVFEASAARPDSGPVTLGRYGQQWEAFRKWLTTAHPSIKSMNEVGEVVAGEYAGHLKSTVSGATFNKHIRVLALVYRVLAVPGRITVNPWDRAKVSRLRHIPEGRRELTIEELRKVCSTAVGDLRLLLAIGLYTGLRLGDAATLRWGEVDLVRGVIRRIPGKTARRNPKPVLVPIHIALAAQLNEADRASEYVLPAVAEQYRHDPTTITRAVKKHFEDCGINTTVKRPDRLRVKIEVGFHSLRHSFVSLCREAGAPLSVVEAIVGHSNPAMTRLYSHTGDAAAGLAIASLPSMEEDKTPAALPSAKEPLPAWARELIEGMTAKTWKTKRDELLKEVAQ